MMLKCQACGTMYQRTYRGGCPKCEKRRRDDDDARTASAITNFAITASIATDFGSSSDTGSNDSGFSGGGGGEFGGGGADGSW